MMPNEMIFRIYILYLLSLHVVSEREDMSEMQHRGRTLVRFGSDRKGSVLIMSAIALPVIIGAASLAAEFGHALVVRAQNQRVADLASYAGALAYSQTKSDLNLNAAAFNIAALNGIPQNEVTVSRITSPRSIDKEAVSVQILTQQPLLLAQVLGDFAPLQIASGAVAEFGGGEGLGGCILALDEKGSGLTLSGGTSVVADDCVVSSNAPVAVPCGTYIKAKELHYEASSAPSHPCGGITAPNGGAPTILKKFTPDPLAKNGQVHAAVSRLTTVTGLAEPVAPSVPSGHNIEFAWNQTNTTNQAKAIGCSASFAQPVWTFSCPGKAVVNVGEMTVGGGISVKFNLNGIADTVYNFSGRIHNGGANVEFAPGHYNIADGIFTGGGSSTSFGAGTFTLGRSSNNCNGAPGGNARFSICNTSTLVFDGPSQFNLQGGFSNSGGSTLHFGHGASANSYRIGSSSAGNALALGGGSTTLMGDALAVGNKFEVIGNVQAGGGGSCLSIGAAAHHDIKGNFLGAGSIIFGAGAYTIDGYFSLGQGGGATHCNGMHVTVHAVNVSFILSGKQTPNNWPCSGLAFCLGAGYNNIKLVSPQAGPYANLAVIGPQSSTNLAGALFTGGAGGAQISGAFYFPNGPITMSGGASTSGVPGGCLQLVGSQISLSGGTSMASECLGASGEDGPSRITLIQ